MRAAQVKPFPQPFMNERLSGPALVRPGPPPQADADMRHAPARAARALVQIARQPIVDCEGRLMAYELLFRGESNGGDAALTARLIVNVFSGIGFEQALGVHPGYVNVDAEFLLSDLPELLPADRVVLEVLETVRVTPALLERIAALRARGYRFAIDDYRGITADVIALLPLVDTVKVELLNVSPDAIEALLAPLRGWKGTLLAEKVENGAMFERCRDAGFRLFQGFHFARPELMAGHRPDPGRMRVFGLLKIAMSDAPASELEEALKRNPDVGFNLLRFANGAGAGFRSQTRSIREALMRLGRRAITTWLQLLVFGSASGAPEDGALFRMAAYRGKLMEQLAHTLPGEARGLADQAFFVGVLSLMHVPLMTTAEALLEELDLDEDAVRALRERGGSLGALLQLSEGLDMTPEILATARRRLAGLDDETLGHALRSTLAWLDGFAESGSEDLPANPGGER